MKCTETGVCSETPVTVVITDICPDSGVCGGGKTHFDLSGASFESIASPRKDEALRKMGIVPILFQRYLSTEVTRHNFGLVHLILIVFQMPSSLLLYYVM